LDIIEQTEEVELDLSTFPCTIKAYSGAKIVGKRRVLRVWKISADKNEAIKQFRDFYKNLIIQKNMV
jgi:hypothetical protein